MLARIRFSDFPLSERGGKAAANVIGTKELADGLSEKISEGRASAEEINKSLRLLKSRALTDELLLSLSCAPEGESFPINIMERRCLHIGCVRLAQNGDHSYHRCFRKRFGEFCSPDIRSERLICALFSLIRAAADLSSDCKVNFSLRSPVRSRNRILRMPCAVSLGISDGQRFRYRSRAVRAVRVRRASDLRFHSFVVAEMHA